MPSGLSVLESPFGGPKCDFYWLFLTGFQEILKQLQNNSSGKWSWFAKALPNILCKASSTPNLDQVAQNFTIVRSGNSPRMETAQPLWQPDALLDCSRLGGLIMYIDDSLLQLMTLLNSPKPSPPRFLRLSQLNNF